MKPPTLPRPGWPWLALLAMPWTSALALAFVDPPATNGTSPPKPRTPVAAPAQPEARAIENDPGGSLERGLEFERRHNWTAAVQVYRDATAKWPSRPDFKQRLRLSEMHQRLVRRYQDASFRNVLIRLPEERALELFDELVERVEIHYVDAVPLEPLIRRGYDNLEVALRDRNFSFLALNAPNASPERVLWLRDQLRARRDRLSIRDRDAAREQVVAACQLARQAIGIDPSPVVLEFVFGCCEVLDDYTACLTPDKLDDMLSQIDGNFVGLGVELKSDEAGLRLVGVIRGGPASEAGLKAGDQIVMVGGQSVKGLGLDEAAGKLQGSEGTAVEIGVVRPDASTRTFRLVRRHVEVESVAQARIVEPKLGIAYIQLTGFQKSSAEELDRAMASLKRQGMRSLVLDLRGNPGGLLNVSVEIADRFVDQGVIVSTRGRAANQSQVYRAKPDKPYGNIPVVVLVDHDSASASEILAGALQELGRAVVVGERSYGKGSVQSIFELRSVPAGLKLTTAKFYSPKNRAYSEAGVTPDIPIVARAKPSPDSQPEEVDFGNPESDRVLRHALRQLGAN